MDLYGVNNYSSQMWQTTKAADVGGDVGRGRESVVATEEIMMDPCFVAFLLHNEYIYYIEAQSGAKVFFCCQAFPN
jgi:hypothetical protein